ncbi:hypothetical protein DBV15_08517 [Temnothorax longispinosus]|uniref:Uncharacterized protein n=1 Tax=Temnothorax longispinosus TaxID=300112 RepID=A0A4S2K4W8_9HYME|nr:hypothetical protein DBV15_08517 [Temnothorax longispinosus]
MDPLVPQNYNLYLLAILMSCCETDLSVFEQWFSLRQLRHTDRWSFDPPLITAVLS